MAFGIVVNGISIPDQKVIAVHDLADHVSAAVVGSKVGLLKSQVLEVRKWLRDGLSDVIERSRKNVKAKPAATPPPARKVFDKKPVAKPKPVVKNQDARKPSALEVLSVIASSSARAFLKDVLNATKSDDRKGIRATLKGLRDKKLVDYKHPGTYSPTLEGINHLRLRDPDCKPHEAALLRARKAAYAVKVESDPKEVKKQESGAVTFYCTDCNQSEGFHADDCSRIKHASKKLIEAKKLNESLDKQSGSVAGFLADIDNIFEKQAIQKLETQVELLNKMHALTGKLAEEIAQGIEEIKTFIGSND